MKKDIEKEIVREVLEDFKLRQLERKPYENNWQLNLNFFLGNQYCYISPSGDIVESEKQYFWQEKEVYNHIANLIEVNPDILSVSAETLKRNVNLIKMMVSEDKIKILLRKKTKT